MNRNEEVAESLELMRTVRRLGHLVNRVRDYDQSTQNEAEGWVLLVNSGDLNDLSNVDFEIETLILLNGPHEYISYYLNEPERQKVSKIKHLVMVITEGERMWQEAGRIDRHLQDFDSLESFWILDYFNIFVDDYVSGKSVLRQLKSLRIPDKAMTNVVDTRNLMDLGLYAAPIGGTYGEERRPMRRQLSEATNLRSLHISDVRADELRIIGQMTNLVSLDVELWTIGLRYDRPGSSLPVERLRELRRLSVIAPQGFDERTPETFFELKNLEELVISSRVPLEYADRFRELDKVYSLTLSVIDSRIPPSVFSMTNLDRLTLIRPRLSDLIEVSLLGIRVPPEIDLVDPVIDVDLGVLADRKFRGHPVIFDVVKNALMNHIHDDIELRNREDV